VLRFGTDGVRGIANTELTPEYTLALGRAAARVLGGERWLIGRDPRRSGSMLEAALVAGLTAEGVDVELLGVVPTPAVAYVAGLHREPGAVISASHNPFGDNGIKLFASGGTKLDDGTQHRLEAVLDAIIAGVPPVAPTVGHGVGSTRFGGDDVASYLDHLVDALGSRRLDGLSVVLDCGHGAASGFAGDVFGRAGADVTVLHAEPDGVNINDGVGSTDTSVLQAKVVDLGADIGLAFDGDADRVIAVDERGEVVDGDKVIALCATDLKTRGELANDTVVVTVMSNLGFRLAMAEAGIEVVVTPVGDRYVLEEMAAGGHALGGEQSGHVVFGRLASTGDGMLTGLLLAGLVHDSTEPLGVLADRAMTRLPQVLHNVRVAERDPEIVGALAEPIARIEQRLGRTGRVLVRPSGTEPLIRVMVEAADVAEAERAAAELVAAVEQHAAR